RARSASRSDWRERGARGRWRRSAVRSCASMKIAQIVAPGASEYERKSQRVDFAALTQAGHQVAVYQSADVDAEIAHVYGKARRVRIPHVVDAELAIPEAVEELYWDARPDGLKSVLYSCGSFARREISNII